MNEGQNPNNRVTINTYVPAYQCDLWKKHAESLDMNLSEFIRIMVQSGRRGFDIKHQRDIVNSDSKNMHETPGVTSLKIQILSLFNNANCLSWNDIVQSVTHSIEENIESTLKSLQEENLIQYNGRSGGYVQPIQKL
jgi:hypothetical protein